MREDRRPVIDAYAHIVPPRHHERIERLLADWRPSDRVNLYEPWLRESDVLGDLDARWRLLEQFPDYRQVLVLGVFPVEELERAVGDLGALGIQMRTHIQGDPLDHPRLEPVFEKIHELGCAIWLHP